jgi:hypothetical protein
MCGRHPTAVRNSDQNNNMSIDLNRGHRGAPDDAGQPDQSHSAQAVGEARACFADHATGRNCRRTNERLAADTVLQLLRVATEVLRGRQRTRIVRGAARAVVYCR